MEEYENIRNGLLALLCVGDKINYIAFGHNQRYNIIYQYLITYVEEVIIRIQDDLGYFHNIYKSTIEHYNGELYIWQGMSTPPYRSQKRIKELAKIVESTYERGI
jgi:hypothetical protein